MQQSRMKVTSVVMLLPKLLQYKTMWLVIIFYHNTIFVPSIRDSMTVQNDILMYAAILKEHYFGSEITHYVYSCFTNFLIVSYLYRQDCLQLFLLPL